MKHLIMIVSVYVTKLMIFIIPNIVDLLLDGRVNYIIWFYDVDFNVIFPRSYFLYTVLIDVMILT